MKGGMTMDLSFAYDLLGATPTQPQKLGPNELAYLFGALGTAFAPNDKSWQAH